MRTVKEPDVRKQEILDGAIRVFAQKGYDKATIAVIAKELNISLGLCYRYFPSKEDIYYAAIEKYADIILEEYISGRQQQMHIRDWIDNISHSVIRLMEAERKNENLYLLFHGSNCKRLHNDLLLKIASKILPHIQNVLRSAKDRGEIHIHDPEKIAVIGLYGEIGTYFVDSMTDEERIYTIQMGWNRLLGLEE